MKPMRAMLVSSDEVYEIANCVPALSRDLVAACFSRLYGPMKNKSPDRFDRATKRAAHRQQGASQIRSPASDAAAIFRQALALHHQDRLAEAEAAYRLVIEIEPDHSESLYLIGVIYHQRGDHVAAVRQIDAALKVNPRNAAAYSNRGLALQELRRFDDALASFEHALAIDPDDADVLMSRGVALMALGRHGDAVASYDRALAISPDHVDALTNRGSALHALGRTVEALASYERALAISPDHPEALANRGVLLHALKRDLDALASVDRALAVRPRHPETLANRGVVLHALERYAEALVSFEEALAIAPRYGEALNNRAITLMRLGRHVGALASLDAALAIRPDYAEALNNRGTVLTQLNRHAEALASFEQALAIKPDFAAAHLNEAHARLLTGQFERGWEKYEWRWQNEPLSSRKRNFAQPSWNGTDNIAGKTIFVHAEQGFGDTLQFCRYVPLLAERGAHVIVEVQPELRRLLSGLDGASVIARGEPLPAFDVHCPLLSLPRAFGTTLATIPPLRAPPAVPPELLQKWRSRLRPSGRPRVGLAWSGRPTHPNDHNRSIPLSAMLPLFALPAEFVSLQKEVRSADRAILHARAAEIADFGSELTDFLETAALLLSIDIVISVDTAVAHLACTLGRPTWIMLPHAPDWRWLLEREDSPWYPSARLFRQPRIGDWASVIQAVCDVLRRLS
jgi:tetratricopeptide (TPR) repeat protein